MKLGIFMGVDMTMNDIKNRRGVQKDSCNSDPGSHSTRKRIVALDYLRAISMLLILLYHYTTRYQESI